MLVDLRKRYRFLEQVYKYHSAVEDEVWTAAVQALLPIRHGMARVMQVLYPALDSKVRNVTLAYSIEHQDEEILFEQLSQLLSTALEEPELKRKGTIRTLICKVEEIHTTLRKHLAKEEEQLLPLLLQHFTFAEQAELVAQFLYSIPLETVERVLSQLKPRIPRDEQEQLLLEIRSVIPDNLLSQLLTSWLQPAADGALAGAPAASGGTATGGGAAAAGRQRQHAAFACCGDPAACKYGPRKVPIAAAAGPAPAPCSTAAAARCGAIEDTPGQCSGGSPSSSDTAAVALAARRDAPNVPGLPLHMEAEPLPPASAAASPERPLPPPRRSRAPLQEIIHFHRSICSSLADFAREARQLQLGRDITAAQLSSLLERHRFLRSVCVFHSISEEEVLFPEVQRLVAEGMGIAAHQCEKDHQVELSSFEDLGRLLADVRAFARRGRKEVASMLEKLCCSAEAVHASIEHHMHREEADVFPLLEANLCEAQQRALVYRTIRAMPLRLLERVMPWVVGRLDNAAADALLSNIRLGAPGGDQALVELLSRWARRGRPRGASPLEYSSAGQGQVQGASAGAALGAPPGALQEASEGFDTCGPLGDSGSFLEHSGQQGGGDGGFGSAGLDGAGGARGCSADVEGDVGDLELSTAPRALLRNQVSGCLDERARYDAAAVEYKRRASHGAAEASGLMSSDDGGGVGGGCAAGMLGCGSGFNPIDHIFQFHKALRLELKQMEQDATALEHAILARVRQHQQPAPPAAGSAATPQRRTAASAAPEAATGPAAGNGGGAGHVDAAGVPYTRGAQLPVVQHFHGRFQFLQGIYRAHSKAEDEIVFPALESKQALRNVSHAYTLDHRQEEQLFADLDQAIEDLRSVDLLSPGADAELSRQVMGVRRMCAAIRASLETHVRSEESELWPLFTEHFSREEQQYLVGVIIGRTGAQVLQALLPWVSETFSVEEKEAMMTSLREATRNTMFDQWLEAVQAGSAGGGPIGGGGGSGGGPAGVEAAGVTASRVGSLEMAAAARMDVDQPLQQVAEYLAGGSDGVGGSAQAVSAAAGAGSGTDSTSFRPGWEDIFRMNQQQLEAAIHRVSNDSSLEPERKAYLMQNIMVSKYIVAQQRRMAPAQSADQLQQLQQQQSAVGAAASTAASADGACHHASAPPIAATISAGLPSDAVPRTFHSASAGVLGCQHYARKCQLVAPCCSKVFTCRLCHDEACDHRMDRYAVSEMRCMLCGERQPVGGNCRVCHSAMARYVCNICHLFDDEPGKDIYHCPFCNVCRRGRGLGVDFFHCMNCNACMSLSLFSSHKCREKCIEGNCPVCHEALFDSSQPIKELPCGHFMHSSCFMTYTRYNYTCPLCCKSVGDMSVYFQMLDSLLASERLPPEYAGRMQQVLCNDCGKMGFAPFHFVYHSCPHCRSYNTRVL
ncbi:hypothetical protein GPECTOR_12g390 [Gonium pectorale]|uniref:Uncharacterized protein n=1 Tax=Gonium pectorale TaxID=33097 RepID=A0A150GNV4_GONPE|nr:hypothetical protein GPECTOR_12g390 [Gonium pectorale]|eukprot:KXZ51428.1 hypothetical protein GPECTOR_12g390 [Gonium pectorale]